MLRLAGPSYHDIHVKPLVAAGDIYNQQWSAEPTTVSRKGRAYTYQNYTIADSLNDGAQHARWLGRRIASAVNGTSHAKRGLVVYGSDL